MAKRHETRTNEKNVEQQTKAQKAATAFMKNFKAKQEEAFKNAQTAFSKAQESQKKKAVQDLDKLTDSVPGVVQNLRKKADHVGHQATRAHQGAVKDGFKNMAKVGHDFMKGQQRELRKAHR